MNRNSLTDYAAYILLKALGPVIRALPRSVSFAFGRWLGGVVFLFDLKHRAVVYANLRTAFGETMSPPEIRRLAGKFFRSLGENIIEIFLIPTMDGEYAAKYVHFEGREHIETAFARGKGVLFCTVHSGSWELGNILSTHLKIPFGMFVRDQKFPRMEGLLNEYRRNKGCRLIRRDDHRALFRLMKDNESTGITLDQGGRTGTPVMFFGKEASMASGAVRLALKYDCALVPVFIRRVGGARLHITLDPVFEPRRTGDSDADVRANLQELVSRFERRIAAHPHEYLWSYKVWKYSRQRRILILSDGKTGHLRQSESLARTAAAVWREKGISSSTTVAELRFRGGWAKAAGSLLNALSGKHICRGCVRCLRRLLDAPSYRAVTSGKYDLVISCGASLAAPNYILSREHGAQSFAVMRPSWASLDRFDLVVIPAHDDPPRRENVVPVEGALNLVDDEYLAEQARLLRQAAGIGDGDTRIRFALLVGGDTKEFRLPATAVREVCRQMKDAARAASAELFVTTSRRTSPDTERAVKEECAASGRMTVIANEANVPFAVGGFLGSSRVVVCSPESISMISEAASSAAHVVVFDLPGLRRRHRIFLRRLQEQGIIRLVKPEEVSVTLQTIIAGDPERRGLVDRERVRAAVRKVLN